MQKKHIFSIALTSIFVAITVVLSRFMSINVWNMSIGFSFVSIFICGMLLGPFWGGVCGALADFIGAILFPFGTYFFGFTATAFLGGAVFGVVGIMAKKCKNTVALAIFLLGIYNERKDTCKSEQRKVDTYAEKTEDPCGGQLYDGFDFLCSQSAQYGRDCHRF